MKHDGFDGLNVCIVCGDAYTTGKYCTECARQIAIDNDPMTGYEPFPYIDPMNGQEYYDYYSDGYDNGDDYDGMFDDDWDSYDFIPISRLEQLSAILENFRQYPWGTIKFLRYVVMLQVNRIEHRLRMRFDKPYRAMYDEIPF